MGGKNIPVYIQIHDQIRQQIEEGKWVVGDRLPSERELALTFNVSRMTLRQAIQTLSDEGILERRIGSGTYVAREKVQETMSGTTSFSEIMLSQGKEPSSKTVSYFLTTPSSSEMEKLKLTAKDKIIRMERIRYADKLPICFEVASIPHELVKNFTKKAITESLYQTLKENDQNTIDKAEQKITAVIASERIAELLEIKKGEPILRVKQISYLDDGKPFEYVRSQYVGSRFEFFLER